MEMLKWSLQAIPMMIIPLRSSRENKDLPEIPEWCLGNAPSSTPHPQPPQIPGRKLQVRDATQRKSLRQGYNRSLSNISW